MQIDKRMSDEELEALYRINADGMGCFDPNAHRRINRETFWTLLLGFAFWVGIFVISYWFWTAV